MNARFVFYLILVTRKLTIEELFNALIMIGRYAFLMRYAFLRTGAKGEPMTQGFPYWGDSLDLWALRSCKSLF